MIYKQHIATTQEVEMIAVVLLSSFSYYVAAVVDQVALEEALAVVVITASVLSLLSLSSAAVVDQVAFSKTC